MSFNNTIFAQSSKLGKSGVAIFRISGPESLAALKCLLQPVNKAKNSIQQESLTHEQLNHAPGANNQKLSDESLADIKPRYTYYKTLYDPEGEVIDQALVVYFKAPSSFTGEDIIEIYTHGSIAISQLLLNTLSAISGLRLAEPGEFAKRAFLNGKMDLTAAEGLADLIDAETILQHRQATKQAGGHLGKLYDEWRQKLLRALALLEGCIDFPDEEIPQEVLEEVENIVENVKQTMLSHLNDARRGERLRNGLTLAIIGRPNVGKSSLTNFLMQRDIAIVSNIAGTTRDIIEGHLDINGYPIILKDTAGIRQDSQDLIELEGIHRAKKAAEGADIKIIMLDSQSVYNNQLPEDLLSLSDVNTILLINKIDLQPEVSEKSLAAINLEVSEILYSSIINNIGVDKTLPAITKIASRLAPLTEQPVITRTRHRQQLQKSLASLEKFKLQKDLVLACEDVRIAVASCSLLIGSVTVEEVLGEIFGNFCIGK